jgi:branched-chain amino acid transport system ATP-binding protein
MNYNKIQELDNSLTPSTLLCVQNLTVYYGAVLALEEASIKVNEGEIVAMIGPNGAGKSTCLRAIAGLLPHYDGRIAQGKIFLENRVINNMPPHELIKFGLALVPEGRHLFPSMSVQDNLEMGAYSLPKELKSMGVKERIEQIFALFPILKERRKQRSGTLSTGEQQMLAMGRGLMLKPKLLLLDEPSLGLSPNFMELIFEKLLEINKNGTSILLVEQNAQMALEVCHRAYVFEIGKIALEGEKEKLINDEKIKKVFLGG